MGIFDWLGPTNFGGKPRGWGSLPAPTDQKSQYPWIQDDRGAALRSTMLVHGPGASELLAGRRGNAFNSAVYACLEAICSAYIEAPLRVWREAPPSKREPIANSPLQLLLDEPNPALDIFEIMGWVQWCKHVDGNAYLRKIRSGNALTGNVVELWPISPSCIEVKTLKGSGDFISFYRYHYAPGRHEDIEPENMIHFRMGLDDHDMRMGVGPLKALAREVSSDEEATRFSNALLSNYAIPGLVVSMPAGTKLTPEQAEEVKAKVGSRYGGDNRGQVGVFDNGASMTTVGWSPEQMDMKALHQVPEERVSAVLRVPAIVAGLGAGLVRSTFANFEEANQSFIEKTILTLYRRDDKKLTDSLARDFSSDRAVIVAHDIDDMRALQDDENKKAERLKIYVDAQIMERNEARGEIGLPPNADPEPVAPPTPIRVLPAPADDDEEEAAVGKAMILKHDQVVVNVIPKNGRLEYYYETPFSNTDHKSAALSDDDLLARYEAGLETLSEDLADDLFSAFEDLVGVVAGRAMSFLKAAADAETKAAAIAGLVTAADHADIRSLLRSAVLKSMRQAAEDLAPLTGDKPVRITRAMPAVKAAISDMESRLPGIVQTTGDDFGRLVRRLERRPGSVPLADVQAALREYVEEAYPGRSAAIARTELGYGHGQGVLLVAEKSGIATRVAVSDGDGDAACRARNGTTATLEDARGIGLLHPNCVLRLIPIVAA